VLWPLATDAVETQFQARTGGSESVILGVTVPYILHEYVQIFEDFLRCRVPPDATLGDTYFLGSQVPPKKIRPTENKHLENVFLQPKMTVK